MTTATVGRPRTPLDVAEAQALARIASLAAQILSTLRQPGRGVYDSERQLRSWLSDDGMTYSATDLAPALTLLEVTGRIGRSSAKQNAARRGWLITASENRVNAPDDVAGTEAVDVAGSSVTDPVDIPEAIPQPEPQDAVEPVRTAHCPVCGGFCEVGTRGQLLDHFYGSLTCAASGEQVADPLNPSDQVLTLIKAIVRALTADNGRSGTCESEEELLKRLDQDGAIYDPQDLPTALALLEGNGEYGTYDTGALPGLPYVLLRPIPDNWQGSTARPSVLKWLRPY